MKRPGLKIGAFEAKTHLAELLRQVENGQSFDIHRRGKRVARLVPPIPEVRKRHFQVPRQDSSSFEVGYPVC